VITRLVLFGATGDLAGRFLLPALARLLAAGHVPPDLRVVAAAAQDWDEARFRDHAAQRLHEHAPELPAADRQALLERLTYRQVDFADPDSVPRVVHGFAGTAAVAAYLALPQRLFAPAIQALGSAGLPFGSRVAVEKPFGEDRAGAVALNALLAAVSEVGDPGAVFRVDHALGMPGAQQLLAVRRGPAAPVWDGAHIQQVDVLWEETLGLEGRADFFDRTGALRDVLQNHMIQVLTLAAMELPHSTSEKDLHEAKLELLQAVRALPSTRRARFSAGTLAGSGRAVPGYAQEQGVEPDRRTETYAELVLQVDHPRWTGTRFVLRAGKALALDRKGVLIHFSPGLGPQGSAVAEQLWIPMDGPPGSADGELSAYGKVLLDVLSGSSLLSVSGEESEHAWQIVEPVLHEWAQGTVPLLEYPAGSAGPAQLRPDARS
jgi:glucose-6-phosphate 1-dehydrogenase